ncbi:MAG: DNA polymerase III subunit delta', partial [Desulfobacteraceae bacterium 4572_19]
MFYSLIEQQLPIQILQNFFLHKIIPNAILISGIEGTGKKKAAITFAMLCNCQSHNFSESSTLNLIDMEPCGKCSSCKKILSATHPDIHIIEPVGKFIVISQIRSMVSSLVQKPYEAKMRFIIIYDAHTMNVESANSLLKSLEEPPARTTIILLSSKPSNLLPTILSRCRQIKFNPISKQTILDTLINTYHIDPEIANITASMANGSLLMALKFANADSGTKDWVGMRNRLLTELTNL